MATRQTLNLTVEDTSKRSESEVGATPSIQDLQTKTRFWAPPEVVSLEISSSLVLERSEALQSVTSAAKTTEDTAKKGKRNEQRRRKSGMQNMAMGDIIAIEAKTTAGVETARNTVDLGVGSIPTRGGKMTTSR